jgi:hypothetical protein
MFKQEHHLRHLDRLYILLLSLYPKRFRSRFGQEVTQVFRDCCHAQLEIGAFGTLAGFCVQTLRDLACSIPREWRREITRIDSEIDYPGLADRFMVSIVVGTNLLGWGWTGATIALDVTVQRNSPASQLTSSTEGIVAVGLLALTVGLAVFIGALSALIVARSRPPEHHRIKIQGN